jgi:plastocyanin
VRRTFALVLVVGFVAVAAARVSAATPAKRVKIGDDFFVRDGRAPIVRVVKDRKVRWVWTGDSPHDVTVTRGPVKFHSKLKRSGSYTRTLTKVGTYSIVCSIHDGMEMTLKVATK